MNTESKSESAIQTLEKLQDEGVAMMSQVMSQGSLISWKGRVASVLRRSLGPDHACTTQFDEVNYTPNVIQAGEFNNGSEEYFRGLDEAMAIIDVALFELSQENAQVAPWGEQPSYDQELWNHIRTHVQNEDWSTVASQTAIFVENCLREWSGVRGKDGQMLGPKELNLTLFNTDTGIFRLGESPSEREGWRNLGTGFALALRNVDTHRIQKRDDVKPYALGVLGLGSLILTQIRHQHSVPTPLSKRPPIGVREWGQ